MNKVLTLLQQATDADLMLSRFDCHVRGLHSIVLKNDNGQLTRAFFTTYNHFMHENHLNRSLALGIHDHLYDITLEGVSGQFCNHVFERGMQVGATLVNRFSSTPELKKFWSVDGVKLKTFQWLQAGDVVWMDHKELHTVFVEEHEMACWLVYEGKRCKDSSWLFSLEREPICNYTPATSADQVREFVTGFFKGF